MMQTKMQHQLQNYYQAHCPNLEDVEVSALTKIAAGWESEIIAFTLTHGYAGKRISQALVLRCFPGDESGERSANEFHSIRRLNEIGYPAPQVFIFEYEHSPFEMPFIIMERLYDSDMWSELHRADAVTYPKLMTAFSRLIVQLHQLDWRRFVDENEQPRYEDPYAAIEHWLGIAEMGHARFPNSGLLPVLEWIQARRDDFYCPRPAPIHNDFHPGNVLLQPSGLPVVIDWTGFDISDPRFDLSWSLMLLYAYLGVEARDLMLREYERISGIQVENLVGFEVFACTRRIFDLSVSLNLGAESQGMRPEAVAAMKQQKAAHERIYEMLVQRIDIRIPEFEEILSAL